MNALAEITKKMGSFLGSDSGPVFGARDPVTAPALLDPGSQFQDRFPAPDMVPHSNTEAMSDATSLCDSVKRISTCVWPRASYASLDGRGRRADPE